MLQNFSLYFQRLPIATGDSTRHTRDMESKATAQDASDFALVTELERLGVFARAGIDARPFMIAERETRLAVLGLTFWSRRGKNLRHRPPSIDTPLLRDQIVQAVLFERCANPKKRRKAIVGEVGEWYGVKHAYIYRCLREVGPERRKQMVRSILVTCFWPEMMAHLQIVAATVARD